jgi:manganese/zinc/iron transport system permease protein
MVLSHNALVVLIGVTTLGVAGGATGTFALLRRRALMGDVLAHATLPGIAGAFLVATALGGDGKSLPVLLSGAAVGGLVGVGLTHFLSRCTRLSDDTAMGVVLGSMFGLGVVLLSVVQQLPLANQAGLNSFLLGQAVGMRVGEAVFLGALGLVSVVVMVALYKELRLVCFDQRFARAQGWRTWLIDGALMGLIVTVTVAGLQAVGIVMVVALLVIPPAAARLWSDRLGVVLPVAALVGGASAAVGAWVSATAARVPTGAAVVIVAGGVFVLSLVLSPSKGLVGSIVRRVRLSYRIARDHALRFAFEIAEGEGRELSAEEAVDLVEVASRSGVEGWRASVLFWFMGVRGLVVRGGGGARLTEEGVAIARRVTRAHRLVEHYLVHYADLDTSHVHTPADLIEHSLSEDAIARLEGALAEAGRVAPERSVHPIGWSS